MDPQMPKRKNGLSRADFRTYIAFHPIETLMQDIRHPFMRRGLNLNVESKQETVFEAWTGAVFSLEVSSPWDQMLPPRMSRHTEQSQAAG
jgi:hypothetical protein